jgi:polyketide synthase PksL
MKRKLRQIYLDLSNGKLSQKEAFEKIKAIKLQEQKIGALLVTPIWQASAVEASDEARKIDYTEHHVVLCELSKVDAKELRALVPHGNYLSLEAMGQKNIAQRYSEYALACFERIQAILQGKTRGKALTQIVIGDHQEQALFAGLAGLLKTAALENPRFIGQLILVPAQTTAEELGRLLREEKTHSPDPLIRYEQGERQVLGWQEAPEDQEKPPIAFKDQGVYLITGGLGSLGLLFAREIIAEARQARVVLTGRSALDAGKQSLLDGLSALEGRLSYRQVDLGDPDQVRRLIASIQDECGQLNGILHCAGMIADNFILKKTGGEFREVLAPKVTGTYNLDQASQDVDLDFFALFSSIASAMGNVGQADYATANGFMDQFAAYRNRQTATGERRGWMLSINWPLWQAGGMRIDQAREELLRQTTGLQPMRMATGLQAFYRGLAAFYDQVLVVEGDLTQIRRALLAGRPIRPELAPLVTAVEQSVALETDAATIDSDSFIEKTQDYLRRQLSEQLKLPSHKIDPQAALEKYGIDSILAMKLTNQLEKTFDSLPKTLFFEYQTIRELAEYFIEHHPAQLAAQLAAPLASTANSHNVAAPTTAPALPSAGATRISRRRASRLRDASPAPTPDVDPIAIIGLSGRYPEAIDIDAYWRNLREGKDCIIEVPRERWDWREYFSEDRSQSGSHYSKWGGFITGVDEFDPLFFNISPKEAKYIDPQERLFLQHAWMAIEDAGYTRASLQASSKQDLSGERDLPGQVGVYVGVMYSEYQLFGAEAGMRGNRLGIAGSFASIANRVSYALNLHGPSLTLDTMCSSSLTAIHLACQDLKLRRTSLAIAGGVNVSIHPNKYLVLSAGQFISSDGHCQSFGEGGDGYIPGEGVGVVVLKRLSEAQRDGDHIYGVIRGSALNHGGKTNGYTVPNPQAQGSVISRALAESGTDPRYISYIEAHGTGTRLGDPIEIAALSKAFNQYTKDIGFCQIGSVKSNIGHCESAAGIAGLTKILLQMRHRQIAPSLHSARLNPHIDFAKTPFVVNQELREWEAPVIDGRRVSRIAGISSFGAGGSNAHLIVEEYQAAEPSAAPQSPAFADVVILLSARTAERLRQKAHDLLEFVRPRLNGIDLVGMAYTLQVGREAMEERLGFVASSVEELAEKLEAYVAGEEDIEGAYQGQASRTREALSLFNADADLQHTIDKWIANKKLSKLLELWVKGLEVDWSKLYGEVKPQRVSLPTYPFVKERYWIDTAAGGRVAVRDAATAVLHPLLHSNTSDLSEQRYGSTFTGTEFFLADHQVAANGRGGQRTLPAVAYLEMARAAIERALPSRLESTVLELRNVVWAQPVIVTEKKSVSISLAANDHHEIDYEIYSQEADQEIIHCQGRAVLSHDPAPARLDLDGLKGQMGRGQVEPSSVYATCARMGLIYGASFQGITAIHRGSDQVLAQLRLPSIVADTSEFSGWRAAGGGWTDRERARIQPSTTALCAGLVAHRLALRSRNDRVGEIRAGQPCGRH